MTGTDGRILVVGGTGRVGGEVVRLLAANGQAVRLLVRDPFKASRLAGPGIGLVQGDLARPESLPSALQGVERVFLLTSSGPQTVPLQSAMITAAAQAGVHLLVRVSALGVGTNPTPAGILQWHGEVERHLAGSGVPGVNLRCASMMQNILGSAETIRRTGQFFGGQGDGKVAFVDARDVAAASVGALAMDAPASATVVLTGPEALSYGDLATILTESLGRPVAYVDLPEAAHRASLVAAGLPAWLVDDIAVLEEATRGTTMAVSDGVRRWCGREARSFSAFAEDYRRVLA